MTRQEYMRKYFQEHKEKITEDRKKWLEKNPNYIKEYYEKNKDVILSKNKEWQKNNKKQFIKLCQESRRRRVERLRAEGVKNAWAVVTSGATPKYNK